MIFDCFPFAGSETELLLLKCRLTELYDVVDRFVIVEAKTDHQGHDKPLNFLEHECDFAEWRDKIRYVIAGDLPTVEENDWSWAREHAQREFIIEGLSDAQPDDIVFQSDLDEIPSRLAARSVRPRGNSIVAFAQRGHFWAIDWEYEQGWRGTTAVRYGALPALVQDRPCGPFTAMRDARNSAPHVAGGGWHFSWLGGREAAMRKVGSFCHPEVAERIVKDPDRFWRDGWHVDGKKMRPVDVDRTWPKWMQDPKNVPASWYRPR